MKNKLNDGIIIIQFTNILAMNKADLFNDISGNEYQEDKMTKKKKKNYK